jgi:hypothetical protein
MSVNLLQELSICQDFDRLKRAPESPKSIEASPRQATGNLHRKEVFHFRIRSLTPPQATGNALAFAVHLPERGVGF